MGPKRTLPSTSTRLTRSTDSDRGRSLSPSAAPCNLPASKSGEESRKTKKRRRHSFSLGHRPTRRPPRENTNRDPNPVSRSLCTSRTIPTKREVVSHGADRTDRLHKNWSQLGGIPRRGTEMRMPPVFFSGGQRREGIDAFQHNRIRVGGSTVW